MRGLRLVRAALKGKAHVENLMQNGGCLGRVCINERNDQGYSALICLFLPSSGVPSEKAAEVLSILISCGADVSVDFNAPLKEAVLTKHLECVKVLLANGADPNMKKQAAYLPSKSALEMAMEGFPEGAELIRKHLSGVEGGGASLDDVKVVVTTINNVPQLSTCGKMLFVPCGFMSALLGMVAFLLGILGCAGMGCFTMCSNGNEKVQNSAHATDDAKDGSPFVFLCIGCPLGLVGAILFAFGYTLSLIACMLSMSQLACVEDVHNRFREAFLAGKPGRFLDNTEREYY